ncbi:MAG: hydroxymethylbilane synthase [Chloroflexi bacterium]|nr:hydroxymethylbilane synthase [Chloroflexota bacterium]
MTTATIIVGTRGSALALRQTQEVVERLQRVHSSLDLHVRVIRSSGDRRANAPLDVLGRGAFVQELEQALLRGEVDLVVHSLKDLPTEQPPGLVVAAVTERADPRDALVDRWRLPLRELPPGVRIGSSSPRRAAQLLALRPDIQVPPIRGNVDTRLRKAVGPDYDGVVLAVAGLARAGLLEHVAEYLPLDVCLPAPGQGALAVEARSGDSELIALLRFIEHTPTRVAVEAERGFLRALGGGCRVPVAAYARLEGESLELTGMVSTESGREMHKASVRWSARDPQGAGRELYRRLLEMGAGEMLGVKEQG